MGYSKFNQVLTSFEAHVPYEILLLVQINISLIPCMPVVEIA